MKYPSRLMSKKDASKYLSVGEPVFDNWVSAGLITPRKIGKGVKYDKIQIDILLNLIFDYNFPFNLPKELKKRNRFELLQSLLVSNMSATNYEDAKSLMNYDMELN